MPAVLALGRRLHDEAPALDLWGTAQSVVGLVASTGLVAVEGFGAWQLAQAGDRAGAAETFDRLAHSAGVPVPFAILGLALPAGLLVPAIGLGRTGAVAGWTAWALAAGAVLLAAGLVSVVKPVLVVGIVCLVAAMGAIGVGDLGSGPREPARPFGGRTRVPSGMAS